MSKNNFPSGFGWSQGEVSLQPHVSVPAGTFEEEHARNGFFGRTSHLYHRHPPTGWLRIEGPLHHHAYTVAKLKGEAHGMAEWFLGNEDVLLGIAKLQTPMDVFFRNGDGDEVRFIHEGSGTLQTDYGDVQYRRGDYLVIPRGTTFRFLPEGKDTHLVIESHSEITLPDRGMLGRHAQFDPMVMRIPKLPVSPRKDGKNTHGEYEVHVKREGELTKVFYPFNPIDIAGWKGDLAPWALNVADIRPIISPRYHLPPSVHTTFLAKNFVICSFLPRPLESEPGAMKVPFYHRNIDFDEVLFYHEGNFFSREGIEAGSVTWHPQGIHHGPHPNAERNAADKTETAEIAVMVDTVRPLKALPSASKVEFKDYTMTWKADQKKMKTITEFAGMVLKNVSQLQAELTAAGKNAEELVSGVTEKFKYEGEKLRHCLNALEAITGKLERAKRVVVWQLGENEKGPKGSVEKDGHAYVLEFFPEPPRAGGKPQGKHAHEGRGGRGGKGGKDGKDKKRGKNGRGRRGPPRGDRPANAAPGSGSESKST